MRRFTEDELNKLESAEPYFKTAVYADYKRATMNKLDIMVADIWDAAVPEKKIVRNFSCGVCSFKMYKQVGLKYYEDKAAVSMELEPKSVNNSNSTDYADTNNKTVANKKRRNAKQKQ